MNKINLEDINIDIEYLKVAKKGIGNGFIWAYSDEGFEYWSGVVRKIDKLIELAGENS